MVSCREYALFACAVLRQANLAARIRVFFNKFYYEPFNHDQILLEFWNENVQEWHKADLRFKLSDLSLKLAISLDFFNVQEEHYISAARAWIDCRAHPNLAMRFFGGNKKGLWYVRDRLIQDLAALNKVEMLLWDCWGLMTCPEKEMTRKNFFLLDQLAEMMLNPDQNFFELREMYFKHEEFRVPKKILSFSPAQGAVSVFIEEG